MRETRFAIQLTRDQIGQKVYPVHRLDKPTSGVLLFALDRTPPASSASNLPNIRSANLSGRGAGLYRSAWTD
ncbi:MAG: pseudouridine synthase [Thiolinea sp.]